MSVEPAEDSSPPPPPPAIHEAERASGASGAILFGPEIDFDSAVARRRAGEDVVVRGGDLKANRSLAGDIETSVGPCFRSDPHQRAGPLALPHWQQNQAPPEGHTFYETPKRKARKKP